MVHYFIVNMAIWLSIITVIAGVVILINKACKAVKKLFEDDDDDF